MVQDTIFALSSGLLPSGVAVVRVSGALCCEILQKLVGLIPTAREARLCLIRALDQNPIDRGLVFFFPAPRSFTGEDCVEFHLHGGKAVVERLLSELSQFYGCRVADPGEFSRRAFLNEKIDLTGAEGLLDLIEAETESQRRLAVMGASGQLAALYRKWRSDLIHARALIEAELDFSEEEDVAKISLDSLMLQLERLRQEILAYSEAGERAQSMRDGVKIVIAGAPNSGKSSLINKLVDRDLSIVTEIAGTTRDVVEGRIVIAGVGITVCDTAGLRKAEDGIEQLGIEKALERVAAADIVIMLEDMHHPVAVELPDVRGEIWFVGNKLDIGPGDGQRWPRQISAKEGTNIQLLVEDIQNFIVEHSVELGTVIPTRRRQLDLLKSAVNFLARAAQEDALPLEIRAEQLRLASDVLGRITGDIHVEDLLDVIFSEFCVGK